MDQQHSTQRPPHLQDRGWRIRIASLVNTRILKLRKQIGCPNTGLPKDEDLYQAIKQHMSRFTTSDNIPGLELKDWTRKNRFRFTEMAISFLQVEGNGAHFWPDGPEAHARNLKYSGDSVKIERLLVQLYWRTNNPEEDSPLQSTETPRGASPCPSDDSWASSIASRRGDHVGEPIDVDGDTLHGDESMNLGVTQENRDNNAPPLSFPEPRYRTFEPPERPPTNGYEVQNTSNTFGDRGRSLPRAPEAPMADRSHGSPTIAESSTAVQNRASRRARKQTYRSEFRSWPDIDLDEDSPPSIDGSRNLHSVGPSSSAQNLSTNHFPTLPPSEREGTSFTVGRFDGGVQMEDALPSNTLGSENAGQPSNISADARAQPRMPSPELGTTPVPPPFPRQEPQSNHIDEQVPAIESHQSGTRDGPRTVPEIPSRETIEQEESVELSHGAAEGSQRLPRLSGDLTAIISGTKWTFPVGDFSCTSLQGIKARSHIHDATPGLSFTLEIQGEKKHHWTVIANDANAFKKMRSVYRNYLEAARREFASIVDEELGFDIFLTLDWEQTNEI